ncbi:MAG TPA: 30S ribosomal protein S9 [Candidatus Acidoferrales bacterium]|nr:30S ribosomal protein S9 [Candidatus Acidoferrales bacterium]
MSETLEKLEKPEKAAQKPEKVERKRLILVTGKRKTAIARAIIKNGSGNVFINGIPLTTLTPEIARMKINEALVLSGERSKSVDINVKVAGGGFMGQAEASRMAVAKGLVQWTRSSELRKSMTNYDRTMLAGDPRRKEPKKFGGPGARRREQKSYR